MLGSFGASRLGGLLFRPLDGLLPVLSADIDFLTSFIVLPSSEAAFSPFKPVMHTVSSCLYWEMPLACCYLLFSRWHSLQTGMYISAPPISTSCEPVQCLKVKWAAPLHTLQIADSFLTFSQSGIRLTICSKLVLKKVALSEDTITIFPLLAACSQNSLTCKVYQ